MTIAAVPDPFDPPSAKDRQGRSPLPPSHDLDDKYRLDRTRAYLTGIEALVRLPMLQHQRDLERGLNTAGFISGYRGSPLGGLDQTLWKAERFLQRHSITFTPGVNEDLAATAVRGSQEVGLLPGAKYDGVFAMWYGKGPGLDRSIDAFRHANAVGTSPYGGVLAVVGDDHGCKSSSYPYQSEHLFMSLSMPVLAPANVQEVLDLGIYGWELSRFSGGWVALKAITENMDSAISAAIDPGRVQIKIPENFEFPEGGVNVRWPDKALDQELRLNKYKIYAARAFALENNLNRIVIDSPRPRLGIITSGKSYLDVLQAFDDLGIDEDLAAEIGLRVYKVGMPWPLEPLKTHEFAEGLEEILVVEEKRSVIEDQLTGQLYNWPVDKRPRVVGEYDEFGQDLVTNLGELTPAMVAMAVASRIRRFFTSESIESRIAFIEQKQARLAQPREMSVRDPNYCSGCPHNTSTKLPEGSIAGGGIGCHYMSTFSKLRPAQGFTHMGGEGVQWTGQAPFTDMPHIFQNIGDGTYFHSGILAIRQSIAAGVNITYKLLYNDAVAMTGGQPVDGMLTVPGLVDQLRGEGVQRIAIVSDNPDQWRPLKADGVSVDHRHELNKVQRELRETPGCTVLIYEQTCATEKRRRRKRGTLETPDTRIFINDAVCEGCGDCSRESNCLSVVPKETEFGRKREIDQAACNMDYSCKEGFCPSFVSVKGGSLKKPKAKLPNIDHLPSPTPPNMDEPWNILVAGVGGTGILTVTAVLAMAAHLEGKGVATMNQTGLAQKFGPVVSHLRIAKQQSDIHAVRIAAGDADLVIGCDLVVAASDDALAKTNVQRSHAIINSDMTATAEFVHNPDAVFHAEAMIQSIREEVGDKKCNFLPATLLAKGLLGDPIGCNLFLLGFAWQKGLIPVGVEAIMQAIELNNVAVDFNQQAFNWGREAAHDFAGTAVTAKLEEHRFNALTDLDEIIEVRADNLERYQSKRYAKRYRRRIEAIRTAATEKAGPEGQRFAIAAAKALHKVMAYKDEYEVARLYTDERFADEIAEAFDGDFKLEFHMAPPLLARKDSETGRPRKIALPGRWTLPMLEGLARLKVLRGTIFDPFRYSADRKLDRQIVKETNQLIDQLLDNLTADNLDDAVGLIDLTKKVRGFGPVKEENHTRIMDDLAKRQFASDNLSGIAPEAWAELSHANQGHAPAYGDDDWTAYVSDKVRDLFETNCDVYFTFNGTAANSLAIASLCQSYHSVITHRHAHVETDECGAPEFFSHGTKVLLADGPDGKLDPKAVETIITARDDVHYPKPRVLCLTQATEHGTVYKPDEIASLTSLARNHGLKTHMDGARFANAVARLGLAPAEITWKAGIDVLCFGGTKNGMPVGDMVVFFDRSLSEEFAFRCKQAGQLASKMRFLSAPWAGMLRDDAWLKHAGHANAMADLLKNKLAAFGVSARHPVEANSVFADLNGDQCKQLWSKGWQFHTFIGEGGARLMCSWDTQPEDIDAFIADLRAAFCKAALHPGLHLFTDRNVFLMDLVQYGHHAINAILIETMIRWHQDMDDQIKIAFIPDVHLIPVKLAQPA
ncbi:ltaE [Symbiodinium microadriaticum]|nr:ltaE [Symbiodinium microadriaticum]